MRAHTAMLATARLGFVAVIVACITFPRQALGGEGSRPSSRPVKQLQEGYVRIKGTHGEGQLAGYAQRLTSLAELEETITKQIDARRSQSIDDILGDLAPGVSKAGPPREDRQADTSAEDIFTRFRPAFSSRLSMPSLDANDLALLRDYYRHLAKAVEQRIMKSCEPGPAMDAKAALELSRLALIVPFLHVADDSFSSDHVDDLPAYLKGPESLKSAERFSLAVGRPLTALQFARFGRKGADWSVGESCSHLREQADRMRGEGRAQAAVKCLQAAVQLADKQGGEIAVETRCELAELYQWLGHPQLGAAAAKEALAVKAAGSNSRGRAAVVRLKCLYAAGQYDAVITECEPHRADEACSAYRPHITYIAWVANRRQNRPKEARRLQDEFLRSYPDSVLCADMYFASAMTELASGEYGKAKELLEIVTSRYPKSKVADKAKDIKERISRSSGGGGK